MLKELYNDLKKLEKSNIEKDYEAERGYSYEDMYNEGYLKELKSLCEKYYIEFYEEEIDWEWCNYIHNTQHAIENRIRKKIKEIKETALQNLKYLYEEESVFTERWINNDNEKFRLKIAKEHMEFVKKIANKYSLKYNEKLTNFGFNDYTEKHYLIDMTCNEIRIKLEKYLVDILLEQ